MIRAVSYTSLWPGVTIWALATGILLVAMTWQLYEDILFVTRAHSVQASVERVYSTVSHGRHGSTTTLHLVYSYHVGDTVVHARSTIQPDTWNALPPGKTFPVNYIAGDVTNNRIDMPAENFRVRLLACLLTGGSLLFLIGGAYTIAFYVRRNKLNRFLLARGIPCQGNVSEVKCTILGKNRTPYYSLVFTFRDARGLHRDGVTWSLQSGQQIYWKPGSPIRVFFDPVDSRKFTVDITPDDERLPVSLDSRDRIPPRPY